MHQEASNKTIIIDPDEPFYVTTLAELAAAIRIYQAQLGERLHGMQEVSGSIPLFSTNQEQNEHFKHSSSARGVRFVLSDTIIKSQSIRKQPPWNRSPRRPFRYILASALYSISKNCTADGVPVSG